MAIKPGQELLHYRIIEKIGEGGMGIVWMARDTRLNRDVAIKLLRDEVSSDAGRLARLQREARALASLQHPNIASIFGLEEAGAERFLVMELVEGEDLAQRLQRGSVPVEEALVIAHQVAEGLEAAHETGIVHRDLKPANVKLTPDGKVKLLDFGLAKAFADEGMEASGDASRSPTLTAAATRAGVILGTAAYMSPEQARARPVDKRADIWAFGCVLYEMLTGRRPFTGETVSDTLAEVLKSEPDWSLLPRETPARVRALMGRCLRKDPKERLRDIGDARLELGELLSGAPDIPAVSGATSHRLTGWMWAAVGLLTGVLATAAALQFFSPSASAPELRKFSIPISELGAGWSVAARLSPDGRRIAYLSGSRLWIRDLRRFEPTEVPDSENASNMFWSPDGTRIGFAKDGKLWTWTLAGGPRNLVCPIPATGSSNGGAWGRDGKIYFATYRGGIYEVAAPGGEPRLVLPLDASEVDFHDPVLLPDGEHLVTATHSKSGPHQVIVVSVEDGSRKILGDFDGLGTVVYSRTGHLLLNFVAGRQRILAVPFSEAGLEIVGDPFLVASGGQFPSVSDNGNLIFTLGASAVLSELVWVDREGRAGQVVGRTRRGLGGPAISPDGRKVAVVSHENENADIWIQDLERGTWSRLVSGPQDEYAPTWSESGDRLFYLRAERDWFGTVMEIQVDSPGTPRTHAERVEQPPIAISPDDRTLVFSVENEGRNSLWSKNLAEETEPVRITPDTSISERHPAISPDGRWLAYVSDEPGAEEVFVRRFPEGGRKLQVSLNGGSSPFWSRGGDALFYWEHGSLIEVPVQAEDSLTLGTARKLFT
ncbi:MAG: protein kinase, partial [Acidobacteriota bacterium]